MALNPDQKVELSEELAKQRNEERYNQASESMVRRAENVPFLRHCYKQQLELDALKEDRSAAANKAFKAAQEQRNENFTYELSQLNDQEFATYKRRQQLRENCPELRDLERRLNGAYANKIVHEQIKEKKTRKLQEEMMEREQSDLIAQAHITEKEHFKHQKELELQRQENYKRELQDQMIFQENVRRTKYEEFLKEKKVIDELVLRIQEEEERELQIKYQSMLRTQEDIRQFKENQRIWREKAKERVLKEDLAIQEFIKRKMEETKKCAGEKMAREVAREKLVDEISKKMYLEKRKKLEKEQILTELLEAEERESHERKHREKVERDIRTRLDVHRALNAQMEERLENMRNEAQRDARYKEELIAQHAENERLQLLSNEKRRLRMMQLRREIEETMKEARLKRAMDMQLMIKEQERLNQEAEKRRLWIEDERVKMIKEHAENLIGFFPMEILTEREVDKLGDDLKSKLTCVMK